MENEQKQLVADQAAEAQEEERRRSLDAASEATEEATSSPPDSPPSTPPSEKELEQEKGKEHVNGNGTAQKVQQQDGAGAAESNVSGSTNGNSNGSNANGNMNDVLMQLRVWKERSSRMEVLLAKKSAKIQEMEETVRVLMFISEAKLKRLLAMAKRSIDNSKHEIAEKDSVIEELREQAAKSTGVSHSWRPDADTRDPKRILHKIAQGNTLWCLVEYASENDMDDDSTKEYVWHSFESEEEIKAYAGRASGEPIALPDFSLTPYESERARKDLKEDIERVQEEFRRYRVRAEITRKQKDAEIRKMSASAVARQTEQISETDVSGELQTARAQIRRLTKAQTETEERVRSQLPCGLSGWFPVGCDGDLTFSMGMLAYEQEIEWRRKFEKLMKDYEKLSGTMGETVLATEWRERYEQVVREKDEMEKKMDDLRILANSHGSGNGFSNGSDLQLLRHEFAQYRKRALNAVEQKEKELNDIQAQYHDSIGTSGPPSSRTGSRNGISTASLRRMSSESSSSLSGFEPPNATTTNEYLKNIVYKYMTSDQDEGKEHMETAIATVLNFTSAEVTAVQSHTRLHREMSGSNGAPVKDQRFQKVHNDPRFARNSKRKNKLQIDQRFAGVFKDERFQSGQGKYDKYGRRIEKKTNELKKFYRLEDEDDNEGEQQDGDDNDEEQDNNDAPSAQVKKSSSGSTNTSTSDEEGDEEEVEQDETIATNDEKLTRLEYLNRMARGELASGSDDSSDSDSDSDDDENADAMDSEPESEKEDVPLGEETKRFAVQNCDWSRIRAVDIFALCQSFAPATGAVHDVTIYPSDFGLQKMKEEEQYGPQGLWNEDNKKKNATKKGQSEEDGDDKEDAEGDNDVDGDDKEGSDEDDDEEMSDDEEYDSDDPLGVKKRVDANDDNGFDAEKLRKYELQKLKYYYAVVTCDSVKTASAIFDNCDQLEYETSSNLLDLRYVPDNIAFTNKPKEVCTSVPDTYKPAIFATTALQNTDVKLTWEEDDENRMELLTRQTEWKNADDNDFSAYLASENSSDGEDDSDAAAGDSDEEEDVKETEASLPADKKKEAKLKKLKNRYRKMLLGSDAEDESGDGDDDSAAGSDSDAGGADEELEGGEMEMTFTPGAGDILKAKKQRELEEQETPFERYSREKKQQKNQKLHDKRAKQKQLEREQKEVLKKKGHGSGANQAKLLREAIQDDGGDDDGDEDGDRNFDLKSIQKSEKVKNLKGKRKAKEMKKLSKKTGLQEGFAFDAADPRFGALYAKGSQFQLDPTDPKFKKTEANQAIFQERRKRTEKSGNSGVQRPAASIANTPAAAATAAASGESKSELKAMVENLKRKSQQQQKSKKPFASSKKQKF